jgi:hypothetical protein
VWTELVVQLDRVVRLDESTHSRVTRKPGVPRRPSIAGNFSTLTVSNMSFSMSDVSARFARLPLKSMM